MSMGGRLAALSLALIACSDPAATPPDASVDAAVVIDTTTSLAARFGSVQRTLDRAYFGVTRSASGATLRIEAYRGGGTGCPTQSSPTTDYTLVLATVPIPNGMMPVSSPGNILDFVGDLLNGQLGAAATAVTITPLATDVCATCNGTFLSVDTSITFAGGTIMGHLYATHCDSLDEQQ
ncbi:MAG: hypothetical protein H0T42_32815 [Deltaproteobacteria bacterium]|nr:hypothetical protein [Deltaproteobacteria bacterium]